MHASSRRQPGPRGGHRSELALCECEIGLARYGSSHIERLFGQPGYGVDVGDNMHVFPCGFLRCNLEKNTVPAGRQFRICDFCLCTAAACCSSSKQSGRRGPGCSSDYARTQACSCSPRSQARRGACCIRPGFIGPCSRASVGEWKGLSLRQRQVLRQDEARLVHVRSRCEGQGRARRTRQGVLSAGDDLEMIV